MRQLTLTEYETTQGVGLSLSELSTIRRMAPAVTITPSELGSGLYDMTPGAIAGAITIGELAIEIKPKIALDRLLFLVSYALDPKRWLAKDFYFGEATSVLEAVIPGFVRQLERAFSRGVLQGYRTEEDALLTLRGRLRFDEQVRRRYGRFPPAEVRYDEFTEDVQINRLLKAALALLSRLRIRSADTRGSLRAFLTRLQDVTLVHYDERNLPEITYNRLNDRYRPAVELAKLFLKSISFELSHGNVQGSCFLLNMNDVFEDFVVVALRDALGLSEVTFPQGAKGRELTLDDAKNVRLEPDISWWEDGQCVFVGDVKYKKVSASGIKHPDLYQLLAYTVGSDLPCGLLVYAAGEAAPTTHSVVFLRKALEVTALDLSGSPEKILASVNWIARQVRRHRKAAFDKSRGAVGAVRH